MVAKAKPAAPSTAVVAKPAPHLYELAAEYRAAATRLNDLDLDEQTIKDTLDGMGGALEKKAEAVAMVMKSFASMAESIKECEEKLARRRKGYEGRAESMKEYLKMNLEGAGMLVVETPWFKLAVRDNPDSVQVDNLDLIPVTYFNTPEVVAVLDKKALAAALKVEREAIAAADTAGDKKLAAQLRKKAIAGAHLASSGTRLDIR